MGHNRADLSLVMFNQQCNLRTSTIIIIKTHTCDIKRREEWIGFSIASRSGFFSDSFYLPPPFSLTATTTTTIVLHCFIVKFKLRANEITSVACTYSFTLSHVFYMLPILSFCHHKNIHLIIHRKVKSFVAAAASQFPKFQQTNTSGWFLAFNCWGKLRSSLGSLCYF